MNSSISSELLGAFTRSCIFLQLTYLFVRRAEADLDLPRIAVIGNQSAGKSSLVEAISGVSLFFVRTIAQNRTRYYQISVPRDAGTCTRCPIECRMTFREDVWTCKISIRWEYNKDGTKRDPVEEVAFGNAITNKKEVELALRRAQAALLNPDKSGFEDSLEEDLLSEANELSFSQNVVCVDLSGPDLVDLAFVDMPGVYIISHFAHSTDPPKVSSRTRRTTSCNSLRI